MRGKSSGLREENEIVVDDRSIRRINGVVAAQAARRVGEHPDHRAEQKQK